MLIRKYANYLRMSAKCFLKGLLEHRKGLLEYLNSLLEHRKDIFHIRIDI